MFGRATATTVTSRISISWATPSSPRVLQRWGWGWGGARGEVVAESVIGYSEPPKLLHPEPVVPVDAAARGQLRHHPEVVPGWELAGRFRQVDAISGSGFFPPPVSTYG